MQKPHLEIQFLLRTFVEMFTIAFIIAIAICSIILSLLKDKRDKNGFLFLAILLFLGFVVYEVFLPQRTKYIPTDNPITMDIVEKACPYLNEYGENDEYGYLEYGQYGKRKYMKRILLRTMSDLCDYLGISQSTILLREYKSLSIVNEGQGRRIEIELRDGEFNWFVDVSIGTQKQFEDSWEYYMTNPLDYE